ncbi:adenosylcobalamin/alpha-ribazole phosphatase [Raoultella sp. Lac2]|uniref:adenosylcobalamin/alpha-ribazole phosphatase n=1 Tax=Klebsiella/Raoultella group TaxID=2890311 RepID=UPI001353727F|nr:adenosylcobalamin/alpha-ribazole phosphatase [Raoultella sp. Lac2]MXF97414.1 adenosylcobalamin/alpha-ribazole phosphatase [Raoultella sp. Lac1]
MKLWLVRHGETEANVAGLYSGHAPTPLTGRGMTQAQTLGQLLQAVPFDSVLCSELERTQLTADLLLGARNIPRQIVPELNEMFFGDWEMRHHRDLQREDAENYAAWCADWQHAAPTNGESFPHFAHRIRTFAGKLTQHSQPDHLLIVGHKGGLSLLIALLLKLPAETMWHFPVAHGAWSELELHADFATLRVLNSQARWQKEEEFRADH